MVRKFKEFIKVGCECGASVRAGNMQKHKRSDRHREKLEVRNAKIRQGGSNPLMRCRCGFICRVKNYDKHTVSEVHFTMMRLREEGIECQCGLFYAYEKSVSHSNSECHVRNGVRKRMLAEQEAMKRMSEDILNKNDAVMRQNN